MHREWLMFLSLLVFDLISVLSNSCVSFDKVAVLIKDTNNRSLNLLVTGCVEKEILPSINAKELYIRNQVIPILGKDSVRHIENLQTLKFLQNDMKQILPGAFSNLPALKRLELTDGNIERVPWGVFGPIPTIELLDIRNNSISVIETYAFANLPRLTEMRVGHNKLKYWNCQWFTNTTNLKILDFSNNFIHTIPTKAFANLPKVSQIFLNFNEISVIETNAFEEVSKLHHLGLQYNRLKEIKEDTVPNNLNIAVFQIDGNYLNFLSSQLLNKLSVNYLALHNNPWKCPCLDRIAYWLFSINGTVAVLNNCKRDHAPVCVYANSYSQSCWELIDDDLSKRYIDSLRKIDPPLPDACARLD